MFLNAQLEVFGAGVMANQDDSVKNGSNRSA